MVVWNTLRFCLVVEKIKKKVRKLKEKKRNRIVWFLFVWSFWAYNAIPFTQLLLQSYWFGLIWTEFYVSSGFQSEMIIYELSLSLSLLFLLCSTLKIMVDFSLFYFFFFGWIRFEFLIDFFCWWYKMIYRLKKKNYTWWFILFI